jgi:hypothetical protein
LSDVHTPGGDEHIEQFVRIHDDIENIGRTYG